MQFDQDVIGGGEHLREQHVVEQHVPSRQHVVDGVWVRERPAASCTLTPEATEGPFYLDINDVRQDITEGKAGAPLA